MENVALAILAVGMTYTGEVYSDWFLSAIGDIALFLLMLNIIGALIVKALWAK